MSEKIDQSTSQPSTSSDSEVPSEHSERFERIIEDFIRHVSSLRNTLPMTAIVIQEAAKLAHSRFEEFVDENCDIIEADGRRQFGMSGDVFPRFKRHERKVHQTQLAHRLVPRGFLVSLVSQFDAFVGDLVRTYYTIFPESLTNSEKQLSLAQIVEFGSIDAAMEFILEKEVESVLRESHADQFKWMENRFGIPLTKDLESWPKFIEVTERRNLFVHTNGIVSTQYLSVCERHGCVLDDDIKVGSELFVGPSYFKAAYEGIFEIAVKLGHVLWRKLLPKERQFADSNLINVTFDLLTEGQYHLAKELLDFSVETLKAHSDDLSRRTFVVNRAQAYKWLGDEDGARKIIAREDWSAASDKFQMADAVLRDDFERASQIMVSIGNSGSIRQNDYRDWPLFRVFRKQESFRKAFEKVFGCPFDSTTPVKTEIEVELDFDENNAIDLTEG